MTRQTLRPLRSYALLAAFAAVAALVVLPAVHGVHAPHFAGAVSLESGLPAIAAGANADSPLTCPLCLGVAQARTAVTPQPALFAPSAATVVRAPLARVEAPPLLAVRAPASPRAPPA